MNEKEIIKYITTLIGGLMIGVALLSIIFWSLFRKPTNNDESRYIYLETIKKYTVEYKHDKIVPVKIISVSNRINHNLYFEYRYWKDGEWKLQERYSSEAFEILNSK